MKPIKILIFSSFSLLLLCNCSNLYNVSKLDISENISNDELVDENISAETILTSVGASFAPTEPTSDKLTLSELPTAPLRPFEWKGEYDEPRVEDLVVPWTEDLVWEAWFSLKELVPHITLGDPCEYKYGDRVFRDLNNDGVDELILTQMDAFKMFVFSYDKKSLQLVGVLDNNHDSQLYYQNLGLIIIRGVGGSGGGYFYKLAPDCLNEIDFSGGFYDERGDYIYAEDIMFPENVIDANEPNFNIYKGKDDLFYVTGHSYGNQSGTCNWICQIYIDDNSNVKLKMIYRWGSFWKGHYGRLENPVNKYEKFIGNEEEPQFQAVSRNEIEDFLKELYGDEFR